MGCSFAVNAARLDRSLRSDTCLRQRLQRASLPEWWATMLDEKLAKAVADGQLLEAAAKNIAMMLADATSDLYPRVIAELAEAGEGSELNDRFYKTLAFGTGGLRGRTIGKVLTSAERGTPDALGRPEFP